MSSLVLGLVFCVVMTGAAVADPLGGWTPFIIRNATVTGNPPTIDTFPAPDHTVEFFITEGGQKAGLGTDAVNGSRVDQIFTLHLDRLDDVGTSGSLYGPYINIWVTDGAGHYAVIANEPSNPEWAADRWYAASWDDLKIKTCKVYETPGAGTGTSWVHTHVGLTSGLTFEDVADLVIAPPPPSYITDPLNQVSSGAPDELGTNVAYGYNWIFGDTLANYLSGYEVGNYYIYDAYPVQNTTQATGYMTIEAALAAANPYDTITVANGPYSPVGTLNVTVPLTLTGESESGVAIQIPAAGGYGLFVGADAVALGNFTLVCNAANQNYPIHASGTANPPGGYTGLTMTDVTVIGSHRRAGLDIHGYNDVVLSHVSSFDAWGGNGIQLTGVVGADLDNITTGDNAWGSLAIYCSQYLVRGSDDVVIDGATLDVGEDYVFSQDEFGLFNGAYSITGYEYNVRNSRFREAVGESDSEGYTFLRDDLADAAAFALAFTGYERYSTIMEIATGDHYVFEGMGIQEALDAATALTTVHVQSGTFTAPAQIVIAKDLTLSGAGAGATTILPGFNTTVGNYLVSDALMYAAYGVTAVIEGFSIDGTGFTVRHAIQSRGDDVTVQDCDISDIHAGPYFGRGVVFLTGAGAVVDCTMSNIQRIGVHIRGGVEPVAPDVTVSGLTYTGKGAGDYLDYGIEIGGGGHGTISGSTITGCLGVASVDGSTSGGVLVTDYYGTGSTGALSGCTLTGNTTGLVVGYAETDMSVVSVTGSNLSGNAAFGATSTGPVVTALGNWWGSPTGPYHPTTNPGGLGNEVSDHILFDPWLGTASVAAVPATSGPLTCGLTQTLTFNLTTDEYTPDVFGFNAVVRATGEVSWGAITSLAPFGSTTQFFSFDMGGGVYAISGTTVGSPTQPISGAGTTPLFTIDFVTVSDGTAAITFDSFTLRDPLNQPIPATATGATIEVDCTAPAAVTGITAAPGHGKVAVSWIHDGTDVVAYEVYRGLWYDTTYGVSAYPEYDDLAGDVIPTRPGSRAAADLSQEWELVDTVAVGTNTLIDSFMTTGRGVYYYEVFPVDAASNWGPAAAANDRATNYWLGDVTGLPPALVPDGEVDGFDMDDLGAEFGNAVPLGDPAGVLDVGPTDDWSRVGVPLTDSVINFEDLMVFAMNFGVVGPAKDQAPISATVQLAWVRYDDGSMALRLVDGSGLKGVNVAARVPVSGVRSGLLLDEQAEQTFLKNVGEQLDVSVALLGTGKGFIGSGDLFTVSAESAIAFEDLAIKARGTDNRELKVELVEATDTAMPRVFSLNANYPNPFNPLTKISFSLPEAQSVRLMVYGVDGRLVKTLLNERCGAGQHEVVWMGRDDADQQAASGVYFYRLDAGPYSQVRKMTLMK